MNIQQAVTVFAGQVIEHSQNHLGLVILGAIIGTALFTAWIFDKLAENGFDRKFLFWRIRVKSHYQCWLENSRPMNERERAKWEMFRTINPKLPKEARLVNLAKNV